MNEVTVQEVQQILAAKEPITLIDVREADELETGKIPGVIHIPLGLLEFKLQDLSKDTSYIMVCRSGARSGRATQFLESHGYQAKNMIGGMMNWDGATE